MYLLASFIFLAVIAVAASLASLWMFDRSLRLQHDRYPDQWIRDGKPIGFFWVPTQARWLGGSLARAAVGFKWSFWTPAWAKEDEEAKQILRYMRVASLVSFIAFFTALAVGLSG